MANRDQLRARLKAADKRRQRRAGSTADTSAPEPSALVGGSQLDAVGALVQIVLAHCQSPHCHYDAVAVSALRGYLKQVPPPRDEARQLYERILPLAGEDPVAKRKFRDAAEQLILAAKAYEKSNLYDTQFLAYLEVLSQ